MTSLLYRTKKGKPRTEIGSYLFPSDQEQTKVAAYLIELGKRGKEIGSYLIAFAAYLFSSDKEENELGRVSNG